MIKHAIIENPRASEENIMVIAVISNPSSTASISNNRDLLHYYEGLG